MGTVLQTNIAGMEPSRGKVRDIYDLGEALLIVATDRISAFDVVMANGVLTQISKFWFDFLKGEVEHHLISDDVADFPAPFRDHAEQFAGRSMLVKKVEVLPIECVVRGYLAGSGWKEYQADGTVCGVKLPAGLKQCDKLPELIFTPATKAELGEHDENISFERAAEIIGREKATYVRDRSVEIFAKAGAYRVGPRGRQDHPDRRGAHARFLALLARRQVRGRPRPGELRQAVRPQLPRGDPLRQVRPGRHAPRGHRRQDQREVHRSLRTAHRQTLCLEIERWRIGQKTGSPRRSATWTTRSTPARTGTMSGRASAPSRARRRR